MKRFERFFGLTSCVMATWGQIYRIAVIADIAVIAAIGVRMAKEGYSYLILKYVGS